MKTLLCAALAACSLSARADVLFDNGPAVLANGLSALVPPQNTYGIMASSGLTAADDFTVLPGQTWQVESLDLYGFVYAALDFPFVSVAWRVIQGSDINHGTLVASGSSAAVNGGLVGYRVGSNPGDESRAIWDLQASVDSFALGAGSYWLAWTMTATGNANSFVPWTADGRLGNAVSGSPGPIFLPLTDQGSHLPVDLPFAINGTLAAVPEPSIGALLLAGAFFLLAARRLQEPIA